MNRIVFLLPCLDIDSQTGEGTPVGGFKVIYEYANRFVKDGFRVVLVYPHLMGLEVGLRHSLRSFAGFCYRTLFGRYNAGEWFDLDKRIDKKVVYRMSSPWLRLNPDDVVFASAYETAVALDAYKGVPLKRKFYFIQDHEVWAGNAESVDKSYLFGMHNIVIAPWLKNIVEKAGAKATVVTNGFNRGEFGLLRPIANRNRYEVVMLNHKLEHKRCCDAWDALKLVKERYPQLHVSMFGVCEPPADMPQWYTYYRNPSRKQLVDLYNKGAIYVAASDFEGFGLTVGEAMICGCAVACTDNGGFACMAHHNETALLSAVYDVNGLAANIELLISDDKLRQRLAANGNEFIKQFDWDDSYNKMKGLVEQNV